MAKLAKFSHVVLETKDCRWKSINLSNMAAELSLAECQHLCELLEPKLVAKRQSRYDQLVELKAPNCILQPEAKLLEKAKRGMDSSLSAVRSRRKKLLAGS